ncbi:hypothetical protein SAMD00019534_087500 [Acytostelium subglobosum LB1]|uniref:hypothetical protein n=1 Tax=Acytostelium subglobosum LB1 TaxID=1410327 RepID=UPI0006450BE5|nr:hypothetical protein SAMD00019534_087500 [Acytostelium subglobosum LB1]GAM25575.1 hypothetical protein SAMD00019534_087500 [Acytostelium subglobosum LB1]|eukprot:XP_012751561.1 hypothetical protein SAMD00019534_087500 [Acytostelium subglobosum LB1]
MYTGAPIARVSQFNQVSRLVLYRHVGSLMVWGLPDCGKMTTIVRALDDQRAVYCQVDCRIHVGLSSLFGAIYHSLKLPPSINSASSPAPNTPLSAADINKHYNLVGIHNNTIQQQRSEPVISTATSCPTIVELFKLLSEKVKRMTTRVLVEDDDQENDTVIHIVLDNVDSIHRLDPFLFQTLLRIHEMTDIPVCIFMVSELPLEKIIPIQQVPGARSPITIHFPQYTSDELNAILVSYIPQGSLKDSIPMYNHLVTIVLDTFYQHVRNVLLLIHILHTLFPLYIHPVFTRGVSQTDWTSLYMNINPVLQTFLNNVYQRDKIRLVRNNEDDQRPNDMSDVGLPYHSKCILIAGFMASTFTQKNDKLLYTKSNVKRVGGVEKKTGPKFFEADRMIAILFSLFPELKPNLKDSVQLSTAIHSLVSLRYFDAQTGLDAKFRCNATYESIKLLSVSIGFNLDTYFNNAEFTA